MLRKIKYVCVAAALSLGLAFAFTTPTTALSGASGSAKDDVCAGITSAGGDCNDTGGLNSVFKAVVNVISIAAGIAAVIMIMIGGFRYVTSGGDSSKVAGAKSAIIYAIVGLVVVALAQAIVRYVANKAT